MKQLYCRKDEQELQYTNQDIEWYYHNPFIPWEVGIMLVKDKDHRFIASNRHFSQYSGVNPELLIGLSDNDMPWSDSKQIYINHEKDVISGMTYDLIEPLHGIKKTNLFTRKKVIHTKSGIPWGTIAMAIPVNNALQYEHLAGHATTLKVSSYGDFNLTSTESKVLYYILKGFSRRKVSELAQVSLNSYDFHLKNIRKKFRADSVDEVIWQCYQKGFHELIPSPVLI